MLSLSQFLNNLHTTLSFFFFLFFSFFLILQNTNFLFFPFCLGWDENTVRNWSTRKMAAPSSCQLFPFALEDYPKTTMIGGVVAL